MHGHIELHGLPFPWTPNRIFRGRRGRKNDIPQDGIAWTKFSVHEFTLSWISTFYLHQVAPPSLLGICVLIDHFSFASSLLIGQLKWSMHNRCSSFLSMDNRRVLSSQWDLIDTFKSTAGRRARALLYEVSKTVVSETPAWRMQTLESMKTRFLPMSMSTRISVIRDRHKMPVHGRRRRGSDGRGPALFITEWSTPRNFVFFFFVKNPPNSLVGIFAKSGGWKPSRNKIWEGCS